MQFLERLKNLVAEERRITVEVLRALAEVEDSRLYAEMGYSSLFVFCTRELGYSEGAAYRRVSAMRLMRESEGVDKKLASGALSLTNAAKLQSKFRETEKLGVSLPREEILAAANGASTRELEKMLTDDSVRSTQDLLKEKLAQLKALLSHKYPGIKEEELLLMLVEERIAREDPAKKRGDIGAEVRQPLKRHIPTKLKAAIWKRDNGRCTYKNCESTHFLEYDHIKPLARGGKTEANNLRLLCRTHNQLEAGKWGLFN